MKKCDPCPSLYDFCWCALYNPKRALRKSLHQIKYDIAQREGFAVEDLSSESRRQEIVRVRYIAINVCRKEGYTLTEIAKSFNRSHSTISYVLEFYKGLTIE